jgi:hypothetical protein
MVARFLAVRDGPSLPKTEPLPTLAGFRDAAGSAFQVEVDDGRAVEVTLLEVQETDRRPGWETFSLLFAGPDEPLRQAAYPVRHDELGSFLLFLVPVLVEARGQGYEAVFNRPAL